MLVTQVEPVIWALLQQDPDLSALEVTTAGLEDAFLALTQPSGVAA